MKNLVEFTYTKDNGEKSYRVGFIIAKPSENYSMLDLSEVSDEEALKIIKEYEKAYAPLREFYKTVPFKYFKSKGISDMGGL